MKKITMALAVILAAASLTYSTPSKAVVGVTSANPLNLMLGAGLVGLGTTQILGYGLKTDSLSPLSPIGLAELIFGIVLLDGESGQRISFSPLKKFQALKLGVTELERKSFNSELDQVNALLEEVSEMTQQDSSLSASTAAWSSVKDTVAPETFSAIQKISRQLAK